MPQVWVAAELDSVGRVRWAADSDSELSRGLAAVLVEGLDGLTPQEVLQVGRGGAGRGDREQEQAALSLAWFAPGKRRT